VAIPALQASLIIGQAPKASEAPQFGARPFLDLFNMPFSIYTFRKLDQSKKEIRLATILPSSKPFAPIRLSLEKVSLDDKPDFEALSYCWGDESNKRKILVDGFPWAATANLYAALCAFRKNAGGQKVRIWIDAVCINQKDMREVEWQVTLMGEVYTMARGVRTWLGPGNLSDPAKTALACDRLRQFTTNPEASIMDDDVLENLDLLADLFRNPYWHRRWITQEIVLAQKLSMYCGGSFQRDVDLRALSHTLHQLATHIQMVLPYHGDREVWNVLDGNKDVWKAHQPYHEIINAITPVTAFDKPLTKHPYLLRDIRGAQQKKDHDCVYGVLGLLKRDLGHTLVMPDYNLPIEVVFQDFAFKLMSASKSLAFLYEAYPEDRALPTWVPDLRVTSRDNNRYIPDAVPLDLDPDSGFSHATFRTAIRFPDSATQRRTNMLAQLDHLFDASAGSKFFAALSAQGVIHLRGLIVDHIADCSAHDKGLRDLTPVTVMEGWIPLDWMDMYTVWNNYPPQEEFEDEILLRTLCADCVLPPDSPARRLSLQDAFEHRKGIEAQRDHPREIEQHPTAFLDASMSLYRFFSTTGGRAGITFGDVQDGDMIVVMASLNMPIVIRGSQYADADDIAAGANRKLLDPAYRGRSLTTYKLVGSCYVHGIMDGEAVVGAAEDGQCELEDVFEDLFLI
jgi:hypothetical protein